MNVLSTIAQITICIMECENVLPPASKKEYHCVHKKSVGRISDKQQDIVRKDRHIIKI